MAADDAWVTVQKSQFDCLRQHCEQCPDFRGQPQDLLNGRAVVVHVQSPSGGRFKKRKILQESGPQGASHQPEPQSTAQPSQEPGSQLSSLSSKTSQWKTPKKPPAGRPGRRPATKPRKVEAVKWFLRNAPKASEWRKRQIELELNTVEQYEQIIRAFTDRTDVMVKREAYRGEENLEHELVDVAKRFALLTKASLTNAKRQKSFATFQALILLSLCEVLRRRDVSYEVIDRTIGHIAGERDRRRLLLSAQWINGVIVNLVNHGWTIYRATELFFIGLYFEFPTCKVELTSFSDALSLTNLANIHTNENLQSIVEHFKTDEFVKHDYGDCLGPEYTIPGLIASLLDACSTPANQISYGFQSDNKGNTEEKVIGLMEYTPPLVTTRIACQRQWRAYTKFRLLVKALPSFR